ncbi:myb/SANT-like DNA-binding domain-containing protein 7 [Dysidea avara]|uniref:myb/SANT-like DNA-binding domain-containing protein 7 n=1 Tax=Dysidea avara TaxID=196820 RepID=UPI00332B5B14
MASWSDKEVLKLIEIWGEQTIQEQLEGCKRNREVFDKISREMAVAGFTRTGPQCREKVKKLKGEYKKIKDGLKQTGNNRKTCKFFEELDEVMGTKPAIAPPVLLDTFSTLTTESSDNEEAYQRNDEESLNNSLTSGGSVDGDGKAEEKQSSEVNDKDEAAEKRVEKNQYQKSDPEMKSLRKH